MVVFTIMSNFFDTICAVATPLSYGGIGIIRVSGDSALNIVQKIFNKNIIQNAINHGWIVENEEKIDEVIVLYFKNPKSYTGEDVIEIQSHGSPVIIKRILNIVEKNGARLAMRGEFTKRAFLNGKIDLSEAEAVMDLISSKTQKSASKNVMNLSGALHKEIQNLRKKILDVASKITAWVDFPEDVKEVSHSEIISSIEPVKIKIEEILKNASSHNLIRDGIKIAVAGRPNVGKSSLFNALLNLDRAIVTDIAGTTRDIITESFEIEGIFATLIDTAGIRDDDNIDKVEKIGINQAKEAIESSNLTLLLYDGTKGITKEDEEIFSLADKNNSLYVSTKADIKPDTSGFAVNISSKTGFNIEKLKQEIYKKAIATKPDNLEFTTNERQQEQLKKCLNFIENVLFASKQGEMQDLILIDIKSALISLGGITGEVVNDEILDGIFDKFCIGK